MRGCSVPLCRCLAQIGRCLAQLGPHCRRSRRAAGQQTFHWLATCTHATVLSEHPSHADGSKGAAGQPAVGLLFTCVDVVPSCDHPFLHADGSEGAAGQHAVGPAVAAAGGGRAGWYERAGPPCINLGQRASLSRLACFVVHIHRLPVETPAASALRARRSNRSPACPRLPPICCQAEALLAQKVGEILAALWKASCLLDKFGNTLSMVQADCWPALRSDGQCGLAASSRPLHSAWNACAATQLCPLKPPSNAAGQCPRHRKDTRCRGGRCAAGAARLHLSSYQLWGTLVFVVHAPVARDAAELERCSKCGCLQMPRVLHPGGGSQEACHSWLAHGRPVLDHAHRATSYLRGWPRC